MMTPAQPTQVFYNARIITLDPAQPGAEAMALVGDKILALGTDEQIRALATSATEIHDLAGQVVVPGFNDSHMHLINLGQGMDGVDLTKARSVSDLVRLGQDYVHQDPDHSWILGRGFNDEAFDHKVLPTRADLDRVSETKPVLFTRVCGHICVANSKALEMAGIAADTPDPTGGDLDRDAETGEPTGILRENAMDLVRRMIPSPSIDDLKRVIRIASQEAASLGLTSVQSNDLHGTRTLINRLEAYRQLAEAGKLPIRVELQSTMPTPEELKTYLEVRKIHPTLGTMVTLGPLKLFTDGSLGGRTAALTDPYADDPTTSGMVIFSQEELDELVLLAAGANVQVAIHAIGDRAMDMVMDSVEHAQLAEPGWTARPRIIHAQITRYDQLERLAKLGIVCDIQPIFVPTDLHFVEARVGSKSAQNSYAWKTMQDLGIHTAGGSDCPVESCNPLWGMHAAITRQDQDGYPKAGWHPEECLTGLEALALFTKGSAYAAQEENIKGTLSPGKLADFVILPEDPTQVDPKKLLSMKVVATYVGGQATLLDTLD
ncbi:MAG: amidohydrolase [Limnochordia bacterium]|nr:amidohydrolase [Limnochordia bacterium]